MMKNKNKPSAKPIYVLMKKEKRIAASFDKNEIQKFQNQLKNNVFQIIEDEYDGGWSQGIQYMDLFLKEIDGVLYTTRDITRAEDEKYRILSSLKNTINSLEELSKDCLNNEDKRSYKIVISDVVSRFKRINDSKLNINLKY